MISVHFVETVAEHLTAFTLIMARMSATFSTLVIFRREMLPQRVAVILSVVLSLFVLISGRVDGANLNLPPAMLVSNLMVQIFLGCIIGFIVNLFIEIFLAMGQIISIQSGLGFVNLFVPKVGTISPLSNFFIIVATLIFFELNGHLILTKMIIESFHINFSGLGKLNLATLDKVLLFSKIIFSGSLMLSLSVIIALLISNMTIGVMTKFAQQLNIFAIGINISLLVCFFVLYISFDAILENGDILLKECLSFAESIEKSIIDHE